MEEGRKFFFLSSSSFPVESARRYSIDRTKMPHHVPPPPPVEANSLVSFRSIPTGQQVVGTSQTFHSFFVSLFRFLFFFIRFCYIITHCPVIDKMRKSRWKQYQEIIHPYWIRQTRLKWFRFGVVGNQWNRLRTTKREKLAPQSIIRGWNERLDPDVHRYSRCIVFPTTKKTFRAGSNLNFVNQFSASGLSEENFKFDMGNGAHHIIFLNLPNRTGEIATIKKKERQPCRNKIKREMQKEIPFHQQMRDELATFKLS